MSVRRGGVGTRQPPGAVLAEIGTAEILDQCRVCVVARRGVVMIRASGSQSDSAALRRCLLTAIAAAAVPVVAVALSACTFGGDGGGVSASTTPTAEVQDAAATTGQQSPGSPGLVVQDAAVWYNSDAGLHRDDVVEVTAVPLADPTSDRGSHLSLVRTGALYLDPASDDVWFHPWGGEPRVVGSGSAAGPGGDPEGDLAAWFEGSELVVYDAFDGAEVARVTSTARVVPHRVASTIRAETDSCRCHLMRWCGSR